MEKLVSCKATIAISTIWLVVFALARTMDIDTVLCGKGMNMIGKEYWRFFIIGFVGSAVTYLVFSFIYKNAISSVGGSGYWYALAGYILIQQLMTSGFPVAGRKWMLIYALVFLPVVPIIPGMNVGTAVFHGIAFAAGVVMGLFGIG